MYELIYSKETCWAKDVCKVYDQCSRPCIFYSKLDYMFWCSRLPKRYQKNIQLTPSVEDLPAYRQLRDIKNSIVEFVDSGQSVFIHSPETGNGKTVWATKLLCKYFERTWPENQMEPTGIFISVSNFLERTKAGFSDPEINYEMLTLTELLCIVPLVVFDDIAVGGYTEYDMKTLYRIINERNLNGLSNIYTANLNETDIEKILGKRLFSRIKENCITVRFDGPDRRRDSNG